MKLNRAHYRAVLEAALDYRESRKFRDVCAEIIDGDVWYVIDGTHAVRLPVMNNPLSLTVFQQLPSLRDILRREDNAVDLKPTPAYMEETKWSLSKKKKTILRKFLAAGGEEVLVDGDILKVFPPEAYNYKIASDGDDIRKNVIFCYEGDKLAGIMLPVYRPQKDAAPDAATSETAEENRPPQT